MAIEKDPKDDINQLADIHELLEDKYSDINSPGIYITKSDADLSPKLVVLDGHSTILVYSNDPEKDLRYEVFNERGQYKWTPENIGDGIVTFPHTFYFEITLTLSSKTISAKASFDGTGINAIALPMKDVPIEEILSVIGDRLSTTISSVLKPADDTFTTKVDKKIKIPKSLEENMDMKLALIGINLKKLTPLSITEEEVVKGKVKEVVFDEPPTKAVELLKEEEAAKKKKKGSRIRKKSVQPIEKEIEASSVETKAAPLSAQAPPPSASRSMSPPPPDAGRPPAKPVRAPAAALADRAAEVTAAKMEEEAPPTPPPAAMPALPPPLDPTPTPKVAEMEMIEEEAGEEMAMDDAGDDFDGLIPAAMEKTDVPVILRHTHATYFERMIPNRAYPLVVKITKEATGTKKSISSISSGERLSEKEEVMILKDDNNTLTIRPEFPGCFVVPNEVDVDLEDKNIEARFHVTPLAIGSLGARIRFYQDGQSVHTMSLETKVITHRLSRWAAYLGALVGSLPAVLAIAVNETPGDFMKTRLEKFAPSLKGLGYLVPGVVTGLFFGISGLLYASRRPSKSTRSVAFPR